MSFPRFKIDEVVSMEKWDQRFPRHQLGAAKIISLRQAVCQSGLMYKIQGTFRNSTIEVDEGWLTKC